MTNNYMTISVQASSILSQLGIKSNYRNNSLAWIKSNLLLNRSPMWAVRTTTGWIILCSHKCQRPLNVVWQYRWQAKQQFPIAMLRFSSS